jgi:hypothetical protein
MKIECISKSAICSILGIKESTPITLEEMARELYITFYPHSSMTSQLELFIRKLKQTFLYWGINVIDYEHTLKEKKEKVKEGTVVIVPGETEAGICIITSLLASTINLVLFKKTKVLKQN